MHFRKTLLFLLLASVIGSASHAAQVGLERFEAVDLRPDVGAEQVRIPIRAFGRKFVMALSPNQTLLASLPGPQRSRIPANDLFLKGTLEGIPGSWVRLNRVGGQYSGGFFDGEELYLIDRAKGFSGARSRGLSAAQTIVFRFGDLDFPSLIDHGGVLPNGDTKVESEPQAYESFAAHLHEVATLQGAAMFAMPLTIVSDVQFTSRHGSNVDSVVASRINFIDGIYANQVGVGIVLLHHEILPTNGALTATDAHGLLGQFQQFMNTGAGSSLPFEGLAHLFTRRDLDGNTVGIAFLGVLCNSSSGYGVDQDLNNETTAALVFAHEVGHNFNAPHDGQEGGACSAETFDGIMSPSISTSRQEFSPCSLREMSTEIDGASCLVEAGDSEVVFDDSFEP